MHILKKNYKVKKEKEQKILIIKLLTLKGKETREKMKLKSSY